MPTKSRSPHNTFNLPLGQNLELQITSDFDQGNLQEARIIDDSENNKQSLETNDLFVKIQVFPALEPFNPKCSVKQSSKNLFNFSVRLNSIHSASDNIYSRKNYNEITEKETQNMYNKSSVLPISPISSVTQKNQQGSSSIDIQIQQKLNGWEDQMQIFDDNGLEVSQSKQNFPTTTIQLQVHIHKLNYVLGIQPNIFLQYYAICIGRQCSNSSDEEPEIVYNKTKLANMKLKKLQDNTFTLIFKYKYQLQYQQDQLRAFKNKDISLLKSQPVYFAYHYPYGNQKLARYLLRFQKKISSKNQDDPKMKIFYQKQTLIFSKEQRPVHLLTITGLTQNEARYQEEEKISDFLYPDRKENEKRPLNFRKPYILITCRVHPGQTSASFALEGFINKLIDCSHQSKFLLKMFTFKIVPIINVDGVYYGTYRMNPQGQNLNRFFDLATLENQPQIYAVQSLLHYYSSGNNILQIYIDFHSHAKPISSFFYGNTYSTISEQVETQAFTRVLSHINPYFSEEASIFSQKNMCNKDSIELMDKSGSGRLCAYRVMKGLPHCYTLEMGYLVGKIGKSRKNSNIQAQEDQTRDSEESMKISKENLKIFTIKDYKSVGWSLVQTMAQFYTISLQLLIKPKKHCQTYLSQLRQSLQKQLKKNQRFKTKQMVSLDINDAILNNSYQKLIRIYPKTIKYINQYFFSVQSSSITQAMASSLQVKNIAHKKIFKKSLTVRYSPKKHGAIQEKKQDACEKISLSPISFVLDPSKNKKIRFNQTTTDWNSATLSPGKYKAHKKKFRFGSINSRDPQFGTMNETTKEIGCHGRASYYEKKLMASKHGEIFNKRRTREFSKQLIPQINQFQKMEGNLKEVEDKYSQTFYGSTQYKIKTPQNNHHKCIKEIQAQKEYFVDQTTKMSSLEYVFGQDGVQRVSSPYKNVRSPSRGQNMQNTLLPRLEFLRKQKKRDSSCEQQGIYRNSPTKNWQPQQNFFKVVKIMKEKL